MFKLNKDIANAMTSIEDDLVDVDEIGGNEYIVRFKREKKE